MKIQVFTIPFILLILALGTGFSLLLNLFVVSVLVIIIGYLWTITGIKGISGQIDDISDNYQVGDWFTEKTTVENDRWLPKVLLQVEEKSDLPGHNSAAFFNLAPKGSYSWQTEVFCRTRGMYSLGALKATVAGPFGFFSTSINFGVQRNLFVYPATLDIPNFQILSRNDLGRGSNQWLASEAGPGASRVREYSVGDTLNRIHWRSTAHARKLMVKEFDADDSSYSMKNIWVVLDMNRDSQATGRDSFTEETGVTIAASLVKKYIDEEKEVGLIMSGDATDVFPPKTGGPHYWSMLKALTMIKASNGMAIDQLLSTKIELFGDNPVVIVITPSANDRLAATLRQIRSRGAVIVTVLLDDSASETGGGSVLRSGSLVSSGFQVYTVKQGDPIDRALDSRAYIPAVRTAGNRV